MVDFTANTISGGAGNEPSFLQYSQGKTTASSGSSLLGALGDTIKAGVDAIDSSIKREASEDVRNKVQAVQDQTISNYMFAGNPPPADAIPPQINSELDRAAKLQQANRMGVVKDTYYNLQLDQIARELRYKYSGYKDYIDGRIQDMTGIKPASALIKSLRQDVYDTMPAEDKRNETVRQELIKAGIDIAGIEAKRGAPVPRPEMESMLAGENQIKNRTAQIIAAHTAKTGIAAEDKQVFMAGVNETLSQDFNAFVKQGMTSKGVTFKEINEMATKFQADPSLFTPKMQEELNLSIGELRNQWLARLSNRLHNDSGGVSLVNAGRMERKDIEDTIKTYTERFDAHYSPLLNKDWGAFNSNTRKIETVLADGQQRLLNDEHSRAFNIANKAYGPQVASQMLTLRDSPSISGLADAANRTAREMMLADALTSRTPSLANADSKIRNIKEYGNASLNPSSVTQAVTDDVVRLVLDKNTDPVARSKAATFLFAPENVGWIGRIAVKDSSGNLKPEESKAKQMEIFQKLTTQDMTNQVKAIGSREPRILDGYVSFALNTGLTVNKTTIDSVKSGFIDRVRYAKIDFNPNTGEFSASQFNPVGELAYKAAPPSNTQRTGDLQEATLLAEQMNVVTRQLTPIIKLQTNDLANGIRSLYSRAGLNIDALSPASGDKLGGRLPSKAGSLGTPDSGTVPFDFGQTMQDKVDTNINQNNNTWSYEQVSHGISQQFVEASNLLAKDPTNKELQKEVEATINAMKDHVTMGREAYDTRQLTQKSDRIRRTLVDSPKDHLENIKLTEQVASKDVNNPALTTDEQKQIWLARAKLLDLNGGKSRGILYKDSVNLKPNQQQKPEQK